MKKPTPCWICDTPTKPEDVKSVPMADFDLRLCKKDAARMNARVESLVNNLRGTHTAKSGPNMGKPLQPISLKDMR